LGFAKRFIILDYFDNVGQRKHEGWLELEHTREKIKQGRDGLGISVAKNQKSG
jgi:hypothetical protein